jgi:RNA polymerase sigma factor (sigma-70 family)
VVPNEQQQNDRNALVLAHLWVVKSLARRLKNTLLFSADMDELISAGNLALVKASIRFESRNGCQFKTYAFKSVRGEMLRSFTRIDGHHDSARVDFTPLGDYAIEAKQESVFQRQEQTLIFNSLLNQLNPRHREVIDTYLTGASLVQLARDKGVKRDRLMKWQRTGIKQLMIAGACYR